MTLLGYPPYSLDCAPGNYHLYLPEEWVGSQSFSSNEELMKSAKTWLSPQVTDLFDAGKQKHVPPILQALRLWF
jgi:hypothetical protein